MKIREHLTFDMEETDYIGVTKHKDGTISLYSSCVDDRSFSIYFKKEHIEKIIEVLMELER